MTSSSSATSPTDEGVSRVLMTRDGDFQTELSATWTLIRPDLKGSKTVFYLINDFLKNRRTSSGTLAESVMKYISSGDLAFVASTRALDSPNHIRK